MSNSAQTARTIPTLEDTRRVIQLSVYVQSLRTFDWQFAFSDSNAVAQRGEERLSWLRAQQQLLDPSGEIWRMVAPRGHGVPGPAVCDSIRGTMPLIGHEDPDDGRREYLVVWYRNDGDSEVQEITLWAHTGADAMRETYERYGLGITVIVQRAL